MKKFFLVMLAFSALGCLEANAQRGIKIAYIDMEYILDKVPDFAEAKNQLEQRAGKWKQEMDVKRNTIKKLKEELKAERALLTKELIEEREEEIVYLEKELIEYQEKRFGPTGDLITQKSVLVKPIQDQVFTIIQDLAEVRKYDFVFDKSSDLTMIFSAQKHDISDLVIRRLTRASKREKLSSKEIKQLEEQEAQEERESDPEYQERQEKVEERQNARQKMIDERNAAREQKRQEQIEKREQQIREREARRNGTTPPPPSQATPAPTENVTSDDDGEAPTANRPATTTPNSNKPRVENPVQGENTTEAKTTATEKPSEGDSETINRQNAAQTAKEEREAKQEARKKAIEERKQKILAEREAAKKAREEQKQQQEEEAE